MADVIYLYTRRQSQPARARDEKTASAEIMFFTGVRYQRMSETVAVENGGGRPTREGGGVKRKRKRG